jgi:hypothetical protein
LEVQSGAAALESLNVAPLVREVASLPASLTEMSLKVYLEKHLDTRSSVFGKVDFSQILVT